MSKYIGAIDQGTTSTLYVFDAGCGLRPERKQSPNVASDYWRI